MKKYLQYWPIIAAILLFFCGRWTAPDNSKELEKKFEAERKVFFDRIGTLEGRVVTLNEAGRAIEAERVQDSIKFSVELGANKRAYSALKKKYNEINLNRADSHSLDSILSRLYPNGGI